MSSDSNPVRVFTALHDIAVAIGGVLEPVELARLVVNRARELLGAGAVGVYNLLPFRVRSQRSDGARLLRLLWETLRYKARRW